MTALIKKLYSDVGAMEWVRASPWEDGVLFTNTNLEEFVKLVVLECAVIVGSMEEPHQDIAELIKQHFGVEE